MNIPALLSLLGALAAQLLSAWRASRRLRRDLDELAALDAHLLRDIGFSPASAAAAPARRQPCCD